MRVLMGNYGNRKLWSWILDTDKTSCVFTPLPWAWFKNNYEPCENISTLMNPVNKTYENPYQIFWIVFIYFKWIYLYFFIYCFSFFIYFINITWERWAVCNQLIRIMSTFHMHSSLFYWAFSGYVVGFKR